MIPLSKPWLTSLERKYAQEAVDSGWISSIGPFIEKFEAAFAQRIGVKYALTTNSGTAACHLSLGAMGFRPGDEIIVPSVTFVATANAVKYCNCDVVLADIDPKTWNMDLASAERLIGPRTVAICIVHLYGNMCDMKATADLCWRNNLMLVEDACEALGGSFHDKQAGSLGKTAAFSFYGNKTISTGEGGMFVTDDAWLYAKAKMLRGQGQTDRYYHPVIGHNYRMTNIEAAIGLAQIERFDEILTEKQRVFNLYKEKLRGIVGWPKQTPDSKHSCWAVTVLVPQRQHLMEALHQQGVETRPVFHPLSDLPPYRDTKGADNCPNAKAFHAAGITLPSYPELSNAEVSMICDIVTKECERT